MPLQPPHPHAHTTHPTSHTCHSPPPPSHTHIAHSKEIVTCAWHPKGQLFASADRNKKVVLWKRWSHMSRWLWLYTLHVYQNMVEVTTCVRKILMCMIYMYLHLDENVSFLAWGYKALALILCTTHSVGLSYWICIWWEDWVWNWWYGVWIWHGNQTSP